MWVWPLGREDPLEQEKETHSSIIAWRIPWREEPGGLQSIGSQRVGHDWSNIVGIHTHMHIHNICMGFSDGSVKNPPAMQETSELIFQLGRSPGGGHGNPFQYSCLENPHRQRNLVGYGPFCRKELDITDQLSTHNIYICIHNVSSVQSDSEIPWITACQASLSITNSGSSNSGPSSWWCDPAISSSVVPFTFCP